MTRGYNTFSLVLRFGDVALHSTPKALDVDGLRNAVVVGRHPRSFCRNKPRVPREGLEPAVSGGWTAYLVKATCVRHQVAECRTRKRVSSHGQAASQLILLRGRFRSGIKVRLKWPTTKTHLIESHLGAKERERFQELV